MQIETIFLRNPVLTQVYVHGDSLRSYLVAVAVPDPENLARFAAGLGIKGSFTELCANKKVTNAVLEDLNKVGKSEGLHGFEQPKALLLHPEPFTVEAGLLTPTAKSKRNELGKYFRPAIDAMYIEVGKD